jgi:adenylosuccinate lyase
VFSGTVLLELAQRGVSREQAYEWVQRNAMRAFHEKTDFKTLLHADRDVTSVLSAADIEKAFDLNEQLRHVDEILDRVFDESRKSDDDAAETRDEKPKTSDRRPKTEVSA